MNISVLICTWNNSRRLEITLESLSQCEVPEGVRWQLVVVNNNCRDDTDAVVQKFSEKLPIVYVHEPRQGLSRAKNAGLAKAAGELGIFTDDDVRVCRDWLKIYWQAYQSHPQGYFWGGPVESEFEDTQLPRELLAVVQDYSIVGFSLPNAGVPEIPAIRFISANWACPLKELRELGGFNEQLGLNAVTGKVILGEETDMMNRLLVKGMKPWYLPQALIRHYVPRAKTAIAHIARRTQALGKTHYSELIYNTRRPKLLGVPLLVYKTVCLSWMKWAISCLGGRPDYKQFFGLHHYRGVWQGFYEEHRTHKGQA